MQELLLVTHQDRQMHFSSDYVGYTFATLGVEAEGNGREISLLV